MSKGLTREEAYWARMSGEPIETPEPITRKDAYMQKAAEKVNAAAAELPAVTTSDSGKSLIVGEDGKWAAENLLPKSDGTGLLLSNKNGEWTSKLTPAMVGNNSVIGASSGRWAFFQALPNFFSASDVGKVLTVDENYKWVARSIPNPIGPLSPVGFGDLLFNGTETITDMVTDGYWDESREVVRLLVVIQIQGSISNKESTSIGILKHSLNKYLEPYSKPLLMNFWNGASGNESSYPISSLIGDVTYEYNEYTQHYTTYKFTPASGASSRCSNSTKLSLYWLG